MDSQVILLWVGSSAGSHVSTVSAMLPDESWEMARGDTALGVGQTELRQRSFFVKPPYMLDRSHVAAQGPLLVFFEGAQVVS